MSGQPQGRLKSTENHAGHLHACVVVKLDWKKRAAMEDEMADVDRAVTERRRAQLCCSQSGQRAVGSVDAQYD